MIEGAIRSGDAYLLPDEGGVTVTVSMRVMSAGDGYKYLLKPVAAGDGDRSLSTPLTRYYTEAGTPPGFWMGSGLVRLGHGELVEGSQVSEAQLQLLIGMGHDPITGDPLGRAYQRFASITERIEQRVNALDADLGPAARAREVAAIEAEKPSAAPAVRWLGSTSRSASRSPSPRSGRSRTRVRNR